MKDINKLCLQCMREKPTEGICPYCGFGLEKYIFPLYHLSPQTILNGKYLVGKAIGEGNFEITYISWDLNLNIPIAIKEYFPNRYVIRDNRVSDDITVIMDDKKKLYEKDKEKLMQEAQSLVRFCKNEEIVLVRDYFRENGTVYIVMEYIVRQTLMDFLKQREIYNVSLSSRCFL